MMTRPVRPGILVLVRFLAATIALVLASTGARAAAQSCIEEGVARLRDADFTAARAALETCEGTDGLSTAELARYYEVSALLHFGTGDEASGELALARLAALVPDHRFSDDAPPSVRSRFASIAPRVARPVLEVEASARSGVVVVSGTVRDDTHGIVRQVRLFARPTEGRFEDRVGRFEAPDGTDLAYYGVAEGIGGAEVARAGSAERPLWYRAASTSTGQDAGTSDDTGGDTLLYVGLAAGAALVVIAAVALAVAVSGSTATQLSSPTPEGFGSR